MSEEWRHWELRIRTFVVDQMASDAAHDSEHIRRVVSNATQLASQEGASLEIVLPAAWLHDCVIVPKDLPLRSQASRLAGEAAALFLQSISYPAEPIPAIQHAIEAHSFSAGIVPRTKEAMVVQDADRLDALGAIGTARCLMLGAALGRRLYDPDEPFPKSRTPDDLANTIDHFYTKLLRLSATMQTEAGRREAQARTAWMETFLKQLGREIGA
jgi:uncharacterized protein